MAAQDIELSGIEKTREIGPYTINSFGHVTSSKDLQFLQLLVKTKAAKNHYKPLTIVEVGSWVGESAIAMSLACPCNSHIICVDTWSGNREDWTHELAALAESTGKTVHDRFLENLEAVDSCCTFTALRHESAKVAREFASFAHWCGIREPKADLVFIDGCHDGEEVVSDIMAWSEHLSAGGIICGHDYCEELPDVITAVNKCALCFGMDVVIEEETSIWFYEPPNESMLGDAAIAKVSNAH